MFDVSWEDPTCETVAQRRERKERDERASNKDSRASSLNSADSNESSKPQLSRIFTAFTKGGSQRKASSAKGTISLLKRNLTHEEHFSTDTTSIDFDSQRTIKNTREDRLHDAHYSVCESAEDTLSSTQMSNEALGTSNATSWSSIVDSPSKVLQVQPLNGNSFITRTTETTVSPQDFTGASEASMSEVFITTDMAPILEEYTLELDSEVFKFPRVPRDKTLERSRSGIPLKGKTNQSLSPYPSTQTDWKAPSDWECVPEKLKIPSKAENKLKRPESMATIHDSEVASQYEPETMHLQRHIRRMGAANPKIMLERIREEWTEVADPAIYQELEFEKQLWMLTALDLLWKKADNKIGNVDQRKSAELVVKASNGPLKVLSLFESQASAAFLATFTTATEVHHLATSPLPSSHIHSLYPLTVPTPNQNLPYGKLLFTSIACLTLPSILPSSSIPPLFKECHRILLPSGTLSLTIIDHSPDTTTMGPKLRNWLDKHLWLNLEKNFRCMSPGRLLPVWLKAAGFSYEDEGSRVTAMELNAVSTETEVGELVELSVMVGRMLWKEVWGRYVEGKNWWWEDKEVLEECRELGTKWECVSVKAVKWL